MNWYCKTTSNIVNKENRYELSFPKRNGAGIGSILYRFFFAYLDSRYVLAMVLLHNKFSISKKNHIFRDSELIN